jgi:microcompartment protein CcmL/EutN
MNGKFTWAMIGTLVAVLLAMAGGFRWVGAVDQQVSDHVTRNAHEPAERRLDKLETTDEVANYRLGQIDNRLDQITTQQKEGFEEIKRLLQGGGPR